MAPIKLEDNIREKLEARELKPTADAWKKLESQLDEKQPKNKPVLWYYAAAGFVGILILASVFFSRNTTSEKNQLVKENVEQNNNGQQKNKVVPKIINKEKVASDMSANSVEENQKKKTNELKKLPQKRKSAIDKKLRNTDALANLKKEETPQAAKKQALAKVEEDKLINKKVDEVVASVKKLQENNTDVTVAEVDALLKNARREIQTQRILKNPKVNATALLQDVEWELDKSFRDKVFDALGEGFNKIRTAVAERNN
jgi:hypothetical protein